MTNVETIPNGAKKATKDEAFRRKLLQLSRRVDALEASLQELRSDEPEGEESVWTAQGQQAA